MPLSKGFLLSQQALPFKNLAQAHQRLFLRVVRWRWLAVSDFTIFSRPPLVVNFLGDVVVLVGPKALQEISQREYSSRLKLVNLFVITFIIFFLLFIFKLLKYLQKLMNSFALIVLIVYEAAFNQKFEETFQEIATLRFSNCRLFQAIILFDLKRFAMLMLIAFLNMHHFYPKYKFLNNNIEK